MNILVLAGTYPHPGHRFSGIFNEKCAVALRGLCNDVKVLAPHSYVPRQVPDHTTVGIWLRCQPIVRGVI